MFMLVGLAHWLGRRSLAGETFLTCSCCMIDRWPLCGLTVHYGSGNQANSTFYPVFDVVVIISGVGFNVW